MRSNQICSYLICPRYSFSQVVEKTDAVDVSGTSEFDSTARFRVPNNLIRHRHRWWPQTAKKDGDKICRRVLCSVWKKRNEYLVVGGVSVRSSVGTVLRLERLSLIHI